MIEIDQRREEPPPSPYDRLVHQLRGHLARVVGVNPEEIDVATNFLDLGTDSLTLLEISQTVQQNLGVKVPFRLLIDDLTTVDALARYLERRLGADAARALPVPGPAAAPAQPPAPMLLPAAYPPAIASPPAHPAVGHPPPAGGLPPLAHGALETIIARHLDLLGQQLELLRQASLGASGTSAPAAPVLAAPVALPPAALPGGVLPDLAAPGPTHAAAAPPPAAQTTQGTASAPRDEDDFVPYRSLRGAAEQEITPRQREHLQALIGRVNALTQGSKRIIDEDRIHHADARTVTGFRRLWKELAYPLVVTDGYGARIRDVDGNEYVDLAMGFGSLLFGHTPPFVVDTLAEQVRRGVRLGPQSYLAGDVARLISELTGAERVTFCNSGTEAIMTALRIARAHTGRDKVVMFAGSYHGIADEVLARAEAGGDGRALPLAPGIPASAVADMLVFRYNQPQSLAAIARHAGELAAVLIEPPRSRTPDIQPLEFLRELRRLTEQHGTLLIFDEIVTGFRTHPGGAQAIFDIHPDLVTYGKTLAGGMPIGVVAGKAAYMGAIDGGAWRYGDDSVPQVDMTYHAGTFCKHPYTMPVAKAVLEHLKAAGPALQEGLNRRTAELVATLNDFFAAEDYPLKVVSFGSLFRFTFPSSLRLAELFYYHLLEHGVYIWEGRNCFLSTAHTGDDVAQVIAAVKASVAALRAGDVLPPAGGGGAGRRRSTAPAEAGVPAGVAVPVGMSAPAEMSGPAPAAVADGPPGAVPLTEAQEQLWILTQLGDEGSRAYNESMTLHLRGDLDVEALRGALETVVARHEALRTVFAADGSWQRFLPPAPVALAREQLPPGGGDRQARIAAWIDAEAGRVFADLTTGPLFRARLLAVSEGWHLLVLTLHHLVSDGFSNATILRELGQLYGALRRGATMAQAGAALRPAVPFRDYVRRRRGEIGTAELAAAESYWLRLFAAPVPVLDLPTDRPRPPLQGYLGDRARLPLDARRTAAVRSFARQQGCTLFMPLLAGYLTLLHRLSGQDDVVAGTPAAGQISQSGGGQLVGYCVNLLPLRSRVGAQTTVAACLAAVKGQLLDAYEHQVYPFQRLLKKIELRRDPSRLPLVAATVTIERPGEFPFAGLETELVWNNNGGSKFEIFLDIVELGDELLLDCEYNSFLFSAATVAGWLRQLRELLLGMAAAPLERCAALPLLGAGERHQILVEWNDTAAAYGRETLIHQLFETQVARDPAAPAVAFEAASLTYGELNAAANRLAHHLATLGVAAARPVGILLHRSLAMVPALLGVLKAGGAYVPIDPAHPAERLRALLDLLAVTVLITESSQLATLAACAPRLPALRHVVVLDAGGEPDCAAVSGAGPGAGADADVSGETGSNAGSDAVGTGRALPLGGARVSGRAEIAGRPASNLPPRAGAGDAAYVIFTSGSTGLPKGVLVTHRPVVNLLRWVNETFAVGPGDRVLFITSLCFDLSVYDVFGLLAAGGSIRIASGADLRAPERLAGWLSTDRVTLWDSAPAALRQLLPLLPGALPAGAAPALRLVLQSGDWVPLALPAQVREHFPGATVVALGGATEATVWSNSHVVRTIEPQWSSIPYGRPIANARYYVLDAELEPAPPGVAGDLFIGGECLSSGYVREPRLTAARYLPDPYAAGRGQVMYRTGDRARLLRDGEIEFLGRLDNQIKIRGFRVELGEIESALGRHPAVRDAAVMAAGEPRGEKRLVAYVIPHGAMPAVEELRGYLKEWLPEPLVPGHFVQLAALPLTPSGKLDQKALPPPDQDRPSLAVGFAPPAGDAEERLAAIWRDTLGVARVGRHDGFFDLGGDSILAVRIAARAQRDGVPLTAAHIFQYPTLAELAALGEAEEDGDSPVGAGSAGVANVADPANPAHPVNPANPPFFGNAARPPNVAGGAAAAGREVPLTPIQRWLLGRDLPHPAHYNQARLLRAPADLTAALVERAWAALTRRHEALRMRYTRRGGEWRQVCVSAAEAAVSCERIDLAAPGGLDGFDGAAARAQAAAITAACARLQAGLDLERGPLVRLALLDCAGGEPRRLAIVIHHLAVDVTSWRILLGDLAAECERLRRGDEEPPVPRRLVLRHWAERLAAYSRSADMERQIPLWTAAARARVRPLPRDVWGGVGTGATGRGGSDEGSGKDRSTGSLGGLGSVGSVGSVGNATADAACADTAGSAARVTVELDEAATGALLHEVPRVQRTLTQDVLLTALAQAFGAWTGEESLLIDLEGNGREVDLPGVDLSRTVGWFTTLYPALVELPPGGAPAAALQSVKQQLRAMPQEGIGHGLLRYGERPALAARLAALPPAEVSFLYLGGLAGLGERAAAAGGFAAAPEAPGPAVAPANPRSHRLEIQAAVHHERLGVSFTYSRHRHRRETVERLAADFLAALRSLIATCSAGAAAAHTPADFPQADVSQRELDDLLAQFSRMAG